MRVPSIVFALLASVHVAALAATPADLGAIRKLADAGRYPQAMRQLDSYLKSTPGDPRGRFLQGLIYTEEHDSDKAIEVFQRLTRDYPALPEPYNNLAVLYAARGEYARARDALLEAINTHPSYATAHENLGEIYARMAGIAYDKALQLDQTNDGAKGKLALLRELYSEKRGTVMTASEPGTADTRTGAAPSPEVPVAAPPAPPPASTAPAPSAGGTHARSAAVKAPRARDTAARRERAGATLEAWAKAWEKQDVQRYLGFYGGKFVPPDGMSRAKWEEQRRERLRSPKYIKVGIGDLRIYFSADGSAMLTFRQRYRSDTYSDKVRKVIRMARTVDGWKIVSERTMQ